ncbi:hypothetical protein [Breznakiella homolactica]|uniref:Radical SAM protein n=1 Tax=Breznakiella homolactica TaxID=2798577 RepID=A0A7T7XQG0_9SPIR|nr:hypothetical protein [Breznakiella homolactica]QQO10617.1 hypothetical protein JFL75_06790 [Breznakiella homolactica]
MPSIEDELTIGSIENHRSDREEGALVYPVYSRRSGGLSLGVNLFPDAKVCTFDCPYCEVFPFETDIRFSMDTAERALRSAIARARAQNIPVKDICFSGNGEPTVSPFFIEALNMASAVRDELVPESALIVITNGTGLLDDRTFAFLVRAAAGPTRLKVWLKLDAGTEEWYQAVDRSAVAYGGLIEKIESFVKQAPVVIQTMVCSVGGNPPSPEEAAAWERLVVRLARAAPDSAGGKAGIQNVQIYGKARPAPEDPLAAALPEQFLESRAASLRAALASAGFSGQAVPVEVFP